jgi:hypothetical protein
MGATPGKIAQSLLKEMDAFYDQGMFTNGLSTIQTDELHSYEEGIQVLGQVMALDYGNPKHLERAMQTAIGLERITGINAAGHRHIRSSYFSGTTISEEGVWGWSKSSSYLALHPAMALVEFNGAPRVRQWLLELADGLLAHRTRGADGRLSLPGTIHFASDRDVPDSPSERAWPLLWAAFRWTGDRKYVQPLIDAGPRSLAFVGANALDQMGVRAAWGEDILARARQQPDALGRHLAWQIGGDVTFLEQLYADQNESSMLREYINTEGSLWTDRVAVADGELQRARLGGIANVRNIVYSGHAVSWQFASPGDEERVGILVPDATPRKLRVVAHNLSNDAIRATMTTWDVEPGRWTIAQRSGATPEAAIAAPATPRRIPLGRTAEIEVTFAPGVATVIDLELESKGTPYWSRPDLGLSADDVKAGEGTMSVTVHSVGAVDAPASRVVLRDAHGRVLAMAAVPALPAPLDLVPKTARVTLTLPAGTDWLGGTLTVETGPEVEEITTRNNRLRF